MLKIALAQINPTVGGFAKNSKKIKEAIGEAKKKKANLIIFPELALCGYPPEDLLYKNHFIAENSKYLKKISQETAQITLILGFVDKKDGQCYNSCALIQNKKIIDVYHKINLPNYGVFDEKRYFSSGEKFSFFNFKKKKIALTICEDIWGKNQIKKLKSEKIDFIINIAASPFNLEKLKERKKILSSTAQTTKSFLFYSNLVGGQDEIVFDGRSLVYSPKGKLLRQAAAFEEDILFFNLNKKQKKLQTVKPNKIKDIHSALCLGLRDYVQKNNFKKTILGLSGGIDSALALAIAVESLGKKKVEALIMPSRYSSQESKKDARKLAKNLGINYQTVNIDPLFAKFNQTLNPYLKNKKITITEENLQARIRANILMAFSNKFGHLVIATGNKSEISCGYCTLYGDLAGGFAPLKDVYKTSVYQLARFINEKEKKEIIPKSIIKKAPSAELKFNQKDSDSLPEYNLLDKILFLYIEKNASFGQIIQKKLNQKTVAKVITMVNKSEYKRRQSPLGIKISQRAFGKDRRMPVTNAFLETL